MALDKNNSTIRKQTKIFSIDDSTKFYARIMVKISQNLIDSSITVGDVIRYDTVSRHYVRSFADTSTNSEVFGIVESIDEDGSANIVTNGSININSSKLINISGANSGGNDVYFLSGITSGKLQNCGSTFPGHIVKPLYQIAPHGDYTGVFRNYLGYPNQSGTQELLDENFIVAFNTPITRALIFNPAKQTFSVKQATFSSSASTFTFTLLYESSIFNIQTENLDIVDFLYNENYDAKISDDGRHILIFAKLTNKVYYIYIDPNDSNTFKLKSIINVNLPGTPEDKIWDADHEIGSFVVSTRAVNVNPSSNDVRHLSPSVSSKIKYYKRNISTSNPFKWKKIHENHAFGFNKDNKSDSLDLPTAVTSDSVLYTSGVYRTNDIRCRRKNYTMSSIALKEDQVSYKSRESTLQLPRYSSINLPSDVLTNINLIGLTGSILTTSNSALDEIYIRNYSEQNRSYALNGHNKSFLINYRDGNDEYHEDHSFRSMYGFLPTRHVYGPVIPAGIGLTAFSSPTGGNETNYLNFVRFGPMIGGVYTEIIAPVENISSSSYTTSLTSSPSSDDICVVAKLYNFYQTNEKRLIVYKYPFYANITNTVCDYFSWFPTVSPPGLRPLAINATSGKEIYGYLKHFKTTDITELNSMNHIKIFGDTIRSFIFTTSYVIVLLQSDSSFIKINLNQDFTKSKHFYTTLNNFFMLNSKIYRYNSTSQSFDLQQTINL
jgi:hypothetical protein